jgi:hypothetical protein
MDKLNKWLTLGANLGLIASLFFLTLQIKQNTSQMRTEASFSINQSLNNLNSAIYQDSTFAELYLRGCKSFSDLNEVERTRFRAYAFDMLNLYIFANQLENQELTDTHTDVVKVMIDRFQKNPGLVEFLKTIKNEWAASDELYQRLLEN